MIINKKLWALGLLIPMFMACDEDEGPGSVVQTFEPMPVLTENITAVTVGEDGGTTTVTIPMDNRQIVAVNIAVGSGASSTATEGVDFTLSTHNLALPAYSGGGSVDITVLPDLDAEGDETIYLSLLGDNPIGSPEEVEVLAITIRDSVYTTPSINMTWDGPIIPFPGFFWCAGNGFIDIDMLIFDGAGNEVTGYVGATGACIETATADDIPDGTYTVEANLWANPITGNGLSTEIIPLRMNIALGGVGIAEFVANDIGLTPVWNGDTPGDTAGANNITMGTVTVLGNQMTLVDGNGTLVATFGNP